MGNLVQGNRTDVNVQISARPLTPGCRTPIYHSLKQLAVLISRITDTSNEGQIPLSGISNKLIRLTSSSPTCAPLIIICFVAHRTDKLTIPSNHL
jgi:hypothetical protein